MTLSITIELIRELNESVTTRHETGIVLTPEGWEVRVMPDGIPAELIAITADELDDITAHTDEPINVILNSVVAGLKSSGCTVRTEEPIDDDANVRVVSPHDAVGMWRHSWAFDISKATDFSKATKIIDWSVDVFEDPEELWRTSSGTYVVRDRSSSSGRFSETWHEMTDDQAWRLALQIFASIMPA